MRLKDPAFTESDVMGQKRARPASTTDSSLHVRTENGHKKTTPTKKLPPPVGRKNEPTSADQEALLQAMYANNNSQKRTPKKQNIAPKKGQAYPQHLKEMMEDGVPVKQWIILLLLLGAGVYQLRKAFMGPASAATAPNVTTSAKGKKGAKFNTKGKAKAKKGAKGGTNRATRNLHLNLDKPQDLTEEALELETPIVKVDNEPTRKAIAKKKKSTKRAETVPKEPLDSPDSISTDGSSSTDGLDAPQANDGDIPPAEKEIPVMESLLLADNNTPPVNEDGWQTVSKDRLTALSDVEEKPQPPLPDVEQPEIITASTVVNPVKQPPVKAPVKQRKPAKTKKVVAQQPVNIISDEDLALMLHQEEQRILQFEIEKSLKEDIWEDVVVHKRKNKATQI